jgi:threonine dehydratase
LAAAVCSPGLLRPAKRTGVQVVAVEPVRIPTLHNAIEAGAPVDVAVSGIAADALGARRIGQVAFEVATRSPPVSVLVEDQAIDAARDRLWDAYRIPSEHGAAAAFAALTARAYQPGEGETVAVVVCGANTVLRTLGSSSTSRV